MELHIFVNRERENLFLARQISARQRGPVMAFIPDPYLLLIQEVLLTVTSLVKLSQERSVVRCTGCLDTSPLIQAFQENKCG